ncbi:hypothetical protein [Peribacillus frigoritolerans]
MEKDTLIIKIKDLKLNKTILSRASGNWDMKLSRARGCSRAIVTSKGVIKGVFKILEAWESDEPAKVSNNNRVAFKLEEYAEYSGNLVGERYIAPGSNPVPSVPLTSVLENAK